MDFPPVNRRVAISRLSKAATAALLFGPACTSESAAPTSTTQISTTTSTFAPTTLPPPTGPGTEWARIQFGVATPYILHRAGKGVLVDTGKVGSAPAIESVLGEIDLAWSDIEHVILTHNHRDNVGGLGEVAALATEATIWAGEEDIGDMPTLERRAIHPVSESDRIFDQTIIRTPGHTAGHISVLDEVSRVLVDGDLLAVRRGEFSGPSADTSDDISQARASLAKLAEYEFQTILIARGDPIVEDAQEVMRLISTIS